jgi:uncharacterized protein (DUF924 family)
MTQQLPSDAVAVLSFWFGSDTLEQPIDPAFQKRWFADDPEFDREIRERFGALITAAADHQLHAWEESPRGALALVLLLDQFTRNVHRDSAQAFAADPTARDIADRALARGFDRAVPLTPRSFFYVPFEHGEALALQDRSVALFHALAAEAPPEGAKGAAMLSDYAEKHRALIVRFGRFPHRNKVLGRVGTDEETEFLKTGRGF